MIKYNLKCENDHEFESWFSDSKEFEKLNKRNYSAVFIVPLLKLRNQSCHQVFLPLKLKKKQKIF